MEQLVTAMALMQQALSLLDQAGDADSSSVHLDLAIERLRELLAKHSARDESSASTRDRTE